MKKKKIEQAVAKCWPKSRERLLADKDFLHFMRYFPAGIGDELKRYFNQVATGSGNFFMVPDREDKQKAVCSRCGKHIVLAKSSHKDRATCPKCGADGEIVHGWRRARTQAKYYFTYFERALYDKEAIIARSFAVYRCISAATGEIFEDYVPREYYLMRKNEAIHWTHECDFWGNEWWSKRRSLYSKDYVMELNGYHVWLGLDRLEPLSKDSWLKYSQLDAFFRLTGAKDAFRYIELYQKHPQLEYIMKMGLWNIVAEGLECRSFRNIFNWKGKTPKDLLGVPIGKGDMLALSALAVDMNTFSLALYLKKNSRFSLVDLAQKRKELEQLSHFDTCEMFDTLKGYGVCSEETLKYILRQQQKKKRYYSIRGVLIDWIDYLKDCGKIGLSLEDTAVLKPHDLQQAHQNVITQLKIKADEELDKQIAQLKEERKQYNFTAGGFLAKVAESSSELIAEGKVLHHCVGTYADRHAKGKCTIILIRRLEEPNVPFYTMELTPAKQIAQVRGDHNCGMTQEVEAFVESYKKYLTEVGKKKGAKAA